MRRVIAKRVVEYDIGMIKKSIVEAFDELGGVGRFIKKDMRVALKPNLVLKKNKEAAATTNPCIVEALGYIIKEAGAQAVLTESPGGPFIKGRLKSIYDETGMTKACENADIILNLDTGQEDIKNEDGMFLKNVTVMKAVMDADIIINLPKLKTHGQMVYTGAVKNMFGIVPGMIKAEHHFRMPDYDDFANSLIDIFLSKKPVISILDAIDAMEGHGPSAGEARRLGMILVSEDAFILDYFACCVINLNYKDVPMLMQAAKRGLYIPELTDDEKKDKEEFFCADFDIPSRDNPRVIDFSDHTPSGRFIKLLKPKPVFRHNKCVLCGECVRSCPADVLSVKNKKIHVDLDGCIRCYCCQEMCPKRAVDIKRGAVIEGALWLDRVLKGRKP